MGRQRISKGLNMAMTPAQRQAAFRKRHRLSKSRINSLVNRMTKINLSRLARRYQVTEGAMLERLINSAANAPGD